MTTLTPNTDGKSYFISGSRHLFIAVLIFLLAVCVHLVQVSSSLRPILVGNELSHSSLLHAIVVRHSVAIEKSVPNIERIDASQYRGAYYSNKPPGFAFLATPFYFCYVLLTGDNSIEGTFRFLKVFNAIISALAIASVYLILCTYRLKPYSIAFGVVAASAGTLFPVYSCLATSIPMSLLMCLLCILCYRLSRKAVITRGWLNAGLALGLYAITIDYSNGFLLFPMIVQLAVSKVKQGEFKSLLVVVSASLLPLVLYQTLVFHNPFVISYAHYAPNKNVHWEGVMSAFSIGNIPRGLYGLLVSHSRGMLLISPVTLFGMFVLCQRRKAPEDTGLLMCMIGCSILITASYDLWHGGHCVGYRHIMITAFLLGGISAFYVNQCGTVGKTVAHIALGFSILTAVAGFFIQLNKQLLWLTWKLEPHDVHANFFSELMRPLFLELIANNGAGG